MSNSRISSYFSCGGRRVHDPPSRQAKEANDANDSSGCCHWAIFMGIIAKLTFATVALTHGVAKINPRRTGRQAAYISISQAPRWRLRLPSGLPPLEQRRRGWEVNRDSGGRSGAGERHSDVVESDKLQPSARELKGRLTGPESS